MVAHPSTDLLRDLNARKAIAFVWDFDRRRMAWASDAAVVFWQEGALTDLVGKAFGPRDAFVTSIEAVRPRLGPGEPATVRLQFNPEGRSLDAACRVRAFALKGERAGALVEIDEIAEPDADGAARRAAALLDQAPVALAAPPQGPGRGRPPAAAPGRGLVDLRGAAAGPVERARWAVRAWGARAQ